MSLINCPECGKEISDKAESCPNCGFPIMEEIQQYDDNYYNSYQNEIYCPKCGGIHIMYQREQSGSIGGGTNTVVIKEAERGHSCIYWMFVGWWLEPLKFITYGWTKPLFRRREHGGFNVNAQKTFSHTVAVCQDCGYSWKV